MIALLEAQPIGVRDLSQAVGISEKDVYTHLEHIRRSVRGKGRGFEMAPCECLSCGYVFKNRSRLKKPGRCPKCRGSHILGAMFRVK
jgi:predicted Zn-ribbon and HTH transcriptional regulator